MYCPICQREIKPLVFADGMVFVHEDVPHPDGWADDPLEVAAMRAGLQ